jgi:hypothetical protein
MSVAKAPDAHRAGLANLLQNPIGMFDDRRATLCCPVRCPGVAMASKAQLKTAAFITKALSWKSRQRIGVV